MSVPADADAQDSADAVLTLDWELSDSLTMTAVSAYSVMDYSNYSSVFYASSEAAGQPKGYQLFGEDFEQFTQEVRLNYSGDSWRGFIGGMYQDQSLAFDRTTRLQTWFSPGTISGGVDVGGFAFAGTANALLDQDLESYALFGMLTHDFTDRFSVSGGLRIGYEEKTADFAVTLLDLIGLAPITVPDDFFLPVDQRAGISIFPLITAAGVVPTTKIDDTSIDGSLNFSYDISDDWMTYVSFAQGTKSAAFNNATISGSFKPEPYIIPKEIARSVEVGAKGSYADGRGTVNVAAFYTDLTDFQDSVFDPNIGVTGAFVIQSFDAETYGIELETRYNITDNLTAFGNLGLLEAKSQATGDRLADAPKVSGMIGADYARPLSENLSLNVGGRMSFSSTQLHQNPALPRGTGEYQVFDFHVGLDDASSGWSVRAEVKNAFEERYEVFSFIQPLLSAGVVGAYNPPRAIFLSVRKSF